MMYILIEISIFFAAVAVTATFISWVVLVWIPNRSIKSTVDREKVRKFERGEYP
jgi:hypothetical protein